MKRIHLIGMAAVLVFGLALGRAYATGEKAGGYERAFQTSRIIGTEVRNAQDEHLGVIRDLVFDSNGRVDFAILGHGGFLGFGEKRSAVPFSALRFDQGGDRMIADITQERLASAPAFDENILRSQAGAEEVYRYYGIQPYWEGEGPGASPQSDLSRPGSAPGKTGQGRSDTGSM